MMKPSMKALLASAAILILTVVHHFYAAAVFDTPWRRHVAIFAVPVLLVMIALYVVHRGRPSGALGRLCYWLFTLVALLIPVAWFGFYHGGYTHLVKDILFMGGVSRDVLQRLCPPCDLSGELVYEVTGVLEFVLALFATYYLFDMWRQDRVEQRAG